jgi:hypothetical protein
LIHFVVFASGPVGWLRSVYRNGQASPCEVNFSDFQYCLKLKSMSKADADASMQERFPPCHKRYAGKHVWEFREPKGDDAALVSSSASSSFPPPGVMSFTGSMSAGAPESNQQSDVNANARSFVSSSDLLGATSATAAWKQLSNCRSCEALLTPL